MINQAYVSLIRSASGLLLRDGWHDVERDSRVTVADHDEHGDPLTLVSFRSIERSSTRSDWSTTSYMYTVTIDQIYGLRHYQRSQGGQQPPIQGSYQQPPPMQPPVDSSKSS